MNEEQWKPFFGGRYEVSNLGRVRRVIPGEPQGRIMYQKIDKAGYCLVSIARKMGEVTRWQRVHRLVAEAFLPAPEPGQIFVNHLNSVRRDNRAENLAWCTQRENVEHARDNGRMQRGSAHHQTHLIEADIVTIRTRRAAGEQIETLARDYDVALSTISTIVRGTTWKHVPGARTAKTTPRAAKLSDDEVRAIRKAYQEGAKQRDLSQQYDVNPGSISMIVHNKTWRHLLPEDERA